MSFHDGSFVRPDCCVVGLAALVACAASQPAPRLPVAAPASTSTRRPRARIAGKVTFPGTPPAARDRCGWAPIRRACRRRRRIRRATRCSSPATARCRTCSCTSRTGSIRAYTFDVPTAPVRARSERLPVRAARPRRARRSAARDRQQRRDDAQRARAAEGRTRNSTRAQPMQGIRMTQDVHGARSDGALQVRRARLDDRVRRRHGAPVLRGHRAPTAPSS